MKTLPPLANRDRVIGAVLVVGCGIVQAAALAVAAFATRDAFAALHGGEILALRTISALALSGAIAALCLYFSRRVAEALGQSYAISLRRVLYEKIARLPRSRHERRRVGALSLRFVGDLSAARLWFGRGLPDVLTALVVLPCAVAILFALDRKLAITGLVPLSLALVVMLGLAWHLENRHRHLRKRRARIAIAMIERIAIAPELDLMGRTGKELRALDNKGASLKAHAVARRGRTTGLQAVLQAGVAFSGLMMLWLASGSGTAPATVAASLSVLSLVALPLRDLGAAWDRYCAWHVAREKAQRLLDEPCVQRRAITKKKWVSVTLNGQIGNVPVHVFADAGQLTTIEGPNAQNLARLIAGLDREDGVSVLFDGKKETPRIAFIGNTHIGLQGSLRRSVTLSARKRPKDAVICDVLTEFGLADLLRAPRGLSQRLAENGNGLSAGQTLRLDLSRAVLGQVDVVVISSIRLASDVESDALLKKLQQLTQATILLADGSQNSNLLRHSKVT